MSFIAAFATNSFRGHIGPSQRPMYTPKAIGHYGVGTAKPAAGGRAGDRQKIAFPTVILGFYESTCLGDAENARSSIRKGRPFRHALSGLGYKQIRDVRQGKILRAES